MLPLCRDLRTVQELMEDQSAVLIGFAFHYFYSIFGFRYWIVGQNMGGYQSSSQPTHCLEIVKNSIAIFHRTRWFYAIMRRDPLIGCGPYSCPALSLLRIGT